MGEIIDFEYLDLIRRGRLKMRSQVEADVRELSKNFSEEMEIRKQRAIDMGTIYPTLKEMVKAEGDE